MAFFLQIEFESDLSDSDCERKFVQPVRDALSAAKLGRVIAAECLADDSPVGSDRKWEIAVEVTDTARARDLLLPLLQSLGAR